MKTFKNVQSDEKPLEIFMDIDTVFIRYNIHEYTDPEGRTGWEYDEDQLTYIEHFKDTLPQTQQITEETLAELSIVFSQYQAQVDAALAELSMIMAEVKENV